MRCSYCGESHATCPLLALCRECDRPHEDYEPSPKDAELAPCDRLCEECHAHEVKLAKLRLAEEIRDGWADWMWDQWRDAS